LVKQFKSKAEAQGTYKCHKIDLTSKSRKERDDATKENRFKILSMKRAGVKEENDEHITIVDVDAMDDQMVPCSSEPTFVYDVYTTEFFMDDGDVGDGYLETLVR